MENGKIVRFQLDGNPFHKGVGVVINFQTGDRVIEVELTTPCKEFNVGQKILIDDTEIIS